MIALIDYGAGNVRSVHKALEAVGADVRLARGPEVIADAAKIVLPGVGAFGDCMDGLQRADLIEAILMAVADGKPLLGICVGLQVLFEVGEELGEHEGLGILPGRVVRLDFSELPPASQARFPLKIPHTGWNQIRPVALSELLYELPEGSWAYFNHAYYGQARRDHVLAVTDYGLPLPSVVGRDNVFGIQFHPEKSQSVGLHILRNFVERVR